jgi:NADH dehydrogenase
VLVPVPFTGGHALAWVVEMLPSAPVTRNQIELMAIDTVVSADVPGFADLGISPRAMEEVLQSILARNWRLVTSCGSMNVARVVTLALRPLLRQ